MLKKQKKQEEIKRTIDNFNDAYKLLEIKSLNLYGYSILNYSLLQIIKSYIKNKKILETGSGIGFNAKLMQLYGFDVKATDINEYAFQYVPIELIEATKAVKKYNDRILFMCWPTYLDYYALYTLQVYTGSIFIYLGELKNGACAEDIFFDILNSEWTILYKIRHPMYASSYIDRFRKESKKQIRQHILDNYFIIYKRHIKK